MKITIRILAGIVACCAFFQMQAQNPPYRPLNLNEQAAGGLNGLQINNKLAVPGYYRTVIGDFNGDSRDDLYLIREVKVGLRRWLTRSLHTFDNTSNSWQLLFTQEGYNFGKSWLSDDVTFLAGDFDKDGPAELIYIDTDNRTAWALQYKALSNTWSTPYTFPAMKIGGWNISPDDRFFVGNFDGTTAGVELLAMSKNSNYWKVLGHNGTTLVDQAYGANGYLGGFNFSGLNFKACVGRFTGEPRDELFIAGDGNTRTDFRLVYFDPIAKTWYATFNSGANHGFLGRPKVRPDDQFFSGNFDFFSLMGQVPYKDELLIYNRSWRYELRTADFQDSGPASDKGFYINGNVDYDEYPRPANPKYYEMFQFHLGHFKDIRYTSMLVNLANCAFSYSGGPNCANTSSHPAPAWSNYNYLPEKLELYHPSLKGHNWMSTGEAGDTDSDGTGNAEAETSEALPFQVEMFPNPASNEVFFQLAIYQEGNVSIEIFDLSGKKVTPDLKHNLNRGYHQLSTDCSALPVGMYLVKVSNGSHEAIEKLIIQ